MHASKWGVEECWEHLQCSRLQRNTCDSFAIHYSKNGTNSRTREEAVVYFWCEYVTECADRDDVTLERCWNFWVAHLTFLLPDLIIHRRLRFTNDEWILTVSTSDILITFSRRLELLDYENFKQKMDVLGSYGLGSVWAVCIWSWHWPWNMTFCRSIMWVMLWPMSKSVFSEAILKGHLSSICPAWC